MFIHQSMNSFFIYQCTDHKLNVVSLISEVLYVYYFTDNKEVVSMETHRFPFSITHQRSAANVRHVLINISNVKNTFVFILFGPSVYRISYKYIILVEYLTLSYRIISFILRCVEGH